MLGLGQNYVQCWLPYRIVFGLEQLPAFVPIFGAQAFTLAAG